MAVLSTPSLPLPGASPPHSITPVPAPGPAATSSAGLPHRPALPTLPPTAPVSPISPSAGGRSKAQRWHDGSPSPCTSYPRTYKDALVSPAAAIQAPPLGPSLAPPSRLLRYPHSRTARRYSSSFSISSVRALHPPAKQVAGLRPRHLSPSFLSSSPISCLVHACYYFFLALFVLYFRLDFGSSCFDCLYSTF